MFYYDNCESDIDKRVKEARFVGSSNTMNLTPKEILTILLNSEYELKQFCCDYRLHQSDQKTIIE